ncbi:hypothetical protein pb186bvf_012196 [Paramecium bursaria]
MEVLSQDRNHILQSLQKQLDEQIELQKQFEDLKIEHQYSVQTNQVKDQTIKDLNQKLQQQMLIIKDDVQIQLRDRIDQLEDQLTKYKTDNKVLNIQIENLQAQNEQLYQQVSVKQTPQIIYVKSNEAHNLIQQLELRHQQETHQKNILQGQINDMTIQIDEITIQNKKLQEKLQITFMKNDTDKQANKTINIELQEENKILKQQLKQVQQEYQDYEQTRSKQDELIRQQIQEKDEIIAKLQNELHIFRQKGQANSILSQIMNSVLPTHLDDYLAQKKELLKLKNQHNEILNERGQLKQKIQELEKVIQDKLPLVNQRQTEFEQLKQISMQQRNKLEQLLNQNNEMTKEILTLQQNNLKLASDNKIQKDYIQQMNKENTRLHQAQTGNQYDVQELKQIEFLSIERQNLIQELQELRLITLRDNQLSVPAMQLNQLQQDFVKLQNILQERDEKIFKLQAQLKLLEKEAETYKVIHQPKQQITHTIEKIKIDFEKNKKKELRIRSLQNDNRKLEFEVQNLQFANAKINGQLQYENQKIQFLEKNLKKLQDENSSLKELIRNLKLEFEEKIRNYIKEYEQNNKYSNTEYTIELQSQNNKFFNIITQNQGELEQLRENLQTSYQNIDQLRDIIRNKNLELDQMKKERNVSFDMQTVGLKIQIEDLKVVNYTQQEILKNLQEQLHIQASQIADTYKLKDKQLIEELTQFSNEYLQHNNQGQKNQFENIQDYKNMLEKMEKQYEELQLRYMDTIEIMKQEFKNMIVQKDEYVQQLEYERKEILQSLDDYRRLYTSEIEDKTHKQNISKDEFHSINEQLKKQHEQIQILQKELDDKKQQEQSHANKMQDLREERKRLQDERLLREEQLQQTQKILDEKYLEHKAMETATLLGKFELQRQIQDLKNQLRQEQDKISKILPVDESKQQIIEQNLLEKQNQLIQLQKEIEEANIAKLSQQLKMEIEAPEIVNFEQDKIHYEQQIQNLKQIRDQITVDDVDLVKRILQDGRLVSYLEKAKVIYESQQ